MIFIMFAPLTDKVKQKSASSRIYQRDEAPEKVHSVPRFHPNCAARPGQRLSLCCNGHARQRFASALCGGRSPAHGRLLAAPLRGSPLCGMERGTSVCPHQHFKQDETTLIVARPTQKIKGHRCEISASAVIPRRELRRREPGGRNAKAHGNAAELTPRPAARQSPLRRCGS